MRGDETGGDGGSTSEEEGELDAERLVGADPGSRSIKMESALWDDIMGEVGALDTLRREIESLEPASVGSPLSLEESVGV